MDDDLFDDLYETENIRGDNSTIDSELQEHLQNIPDIETVMARTEAEVAGGVADPRYQHDTSSDEGDDNSDEETGNEKEAPAGSASASASVSASESEESNARAPPPKKKKKQGKAKKAPPPTNHHSHPYLRWKIPVIRLRLHSGLGVPLPPSGSC